MIYTFSSRFKLFRNLRIFFRHICIPKIPEFTKHVLFQVWVSQHHQLSETLYLSSIVALFSWKREMKNVMIKSNPFYPIVGNSQYLPCQLSLNQTEAPRVLTLPVEPQSVCEIQPFAHHLYTITINEASII